MKRRRQINKSHELVRKNIVGADKKECTNKNKKASKRFKTTDEDDETSTPSATPTGNNGTMPVTKPLAVNQEKDEDQDQQDATITYILQALKDREEKLKQSNDQQFAAQRQIYDQNFSDFMKDIENYIATNKK